MRWVLLLDGELVGYLIGRDDGCGIRGDLLLLVVGLDGAFEGHSAILSNDLHVMRVRGKGFVRNDRFCES